MITSLSYCSAQLEKIDNLLLDEVQIIPLRYYKRKVEFRHLEKVYKRLYRNHFIDFPVEVVPSADEVYIPHDDLINYYKYHAICNKTSDTKLFEMIGNNGDFALRELISSMIHEKIINLSFEFEGILKAARSSYIFAGITDQIAIIRNVLNLHINVRKKDDAQIAHLGGIKLPKSIADLMTDIYIIYLSDRLEMLELKDVHAEHAFITNMDEDQKIKWNGKQQHLVELFLELEKKGWITWDELSRKKAATLLCRIFDLSDTKRKADSNSADSIYQLIKGEIDKSDQYKRKYFFDTDLKYKRQFANIITSRK